MLFCPGDNYADALVGDGVVELCPKDVYDPYLVCDPYICDPYSTTPSPYFCPVRYFTEIIINGNLVIPPQKPPKSHIVKATHLIKIKDVEVIEVILPGSTTPAGYKILVSGIFTLGLQYVADVPDQKVHFVHYDLPFNAILLDDCGGLIPVKPENFVIHVCVENMRFRQIDNRTINKEILLMIWAQQKA